MYLKLHFSICILQNLKVSCSVHLLHHDVEWQVYFFPQKNDWSLWSVLLAAKTNFILFWLTSVLIIKMTLSKHLDNIILALYLVVLWHNCLFVHFSGTLLWWEECCLFYWLSFCSLDSYVQLYRTRYRSSDRFTPVIVTCWMHLYSQCLQ